MHAVTQPAALTIAQHRLEALHTEMLPLHCLQAIAAQLQRDPEADYADAAAARPVPTAASTSGSDADDPKVAKPDAAAKDTLPDAKVMADMPVKAAAQHRAA